MVIYTCSLSLASKFRFSKIIVVIFIPGYKVSSGQLYVRWDFTFAFLSAKSWRALTRVFLERRDLITIDELVIFFDPSILLPASILTCGEKAIAALFYHVRRKSFFFPFLHSESFRIARSAHQILCTSKATRPDASRTRQYILLLLRLLPHFLYAPSLRILFSLLFHRFFHFKDGHESSWKTYTLRALIFHDLDEYVLVVCDTLYLMFF